MLKQIGPYFLAGSLFVIGLGLGFFIGQRNTPASISQPPKSNDNSFYSSQNAFVAGEITSINGNSLTVKNLYNQTGDIVVSSRVVITKPGGSAPLTLSDLETNKRVLINLEMIDGQYEAVSIQYSNPPPSVPPSPSKKP